MTRFLNSFVLANVFLIGLIIRPVEAGAAEIDRFSIICSSIAQISQINWSSMGDSGLIEALKKDDQSFIREAIWLGGDPQKLKGSKWYSYGQKERLNVLLMAAVASDNAEVVRSLLDRGANPNVNAQTDYFMTPMITAARCASPSVLRSLMKAGASATQTTSYGGDRGATIYDTSALRWAAERGNLAVVETLLENGADPKVQEVILDAHVPATDKKLGVNALFVSSTPEITKALIKFKADPNISNWRGSTPLMSAAERGNLGVCMVLMKAGARRDQQDSDGKTAYDLAREWKHYNVADKIKRFQ